VAWARGRRCGKYNAKKTVLDGVTYASKLEARRANELAMLERAGAIVGLQRQVPFDLNVNGHLICRYIADFCYTTAETGESVVEDVKGMLTPEFRLKAKLMEAIHGIVIQVWTGKPQWALDVNKGRWLRKTKPPASPKTSMRGAGSPRKS
jgi:hypothetical protein